MKKRRKVILFLMLSLLIVKFIAVCTSKAEATQTRKILYVGGSGPYNYTKIQDAIDNASDGYNLCLQWNI